ncbi:MAG: MarR family transcriptional regulator [Coleofasciculaceae cyanobacterium SM2_1_6]|nr:MarR family transcriptional regulator [Coleofasciculaceae cyanobacterium SM2_1_6]
MEEDAVDRILGQWHLERPDLDVSPMGVIGRMGRLAKHLDRSIQETVSEFELNLGEFDVLATLLRSGSPYQLSPTDLFNALMVTSGTMTNRIDQLERAALVRRTPDPHDRRGTLIALTEKGQDLIGQAIEAHVANLHRLVNVLEESERQSLALLLRKLVLSFEEKS